MKLFPRALSRLIAQLNALPTIGEKSATRLAYHFVSGGNKHAEELASALSQAIAEVRLCEQCFFLSESNLCSICSDESRDSSIVCVVEKPMDVVAIERAGEFKGKYHVLHGLWSPLRGKDIDSIKLKQLIVRCEESISGNLNSADKKISEVIIATAATVEGDATALYLARHLTDLNVKVTRLAQGLPKGGDLEYLDDFTLSKALSGRNSIN